MMFVGYDLYGDKHCMDSAPNYIPDITSVGVSNGIFDDLYITRNPNAPETTEIPTVWDYDTILNANFNGDLSAGNTEFLIEQVKAIKIKRRVKGTFNWLTLKRAQIDGNIDNLTFTFRDTLNKNETEYEYAFVPVFSEGDNEVEGNYVINSILSKFNGVYVGDMDNIFTFLYGVNYNNNKRNRQVGVFEPLGRRYPIFVSNGVLSYDSGTVEATILNDDFDETRRIDRVAITKKKDRLKEFLSDGKAKFLKDINGQIWLIVCTSAPDFSYDSNTFMSYPKMSFSWAEIGDAESQTDLYQHGIISEAD